MPFTGSAPNKTYQRTDGTRTGSAVNVTAKANGVNDTAALADARENDIADALSTSWQINGDNQPIAHLPMNDKKFTGMGQGSARTDSLRIDQVQDGDLIYAEASGTANAIVLTTSPSCSAVEGMVIGFVAEVDSTSTVTVDLNGNGAVALQVGGAACAGGEIQNGQFHKIGFDGTQWQLLNPLWPNVTAFAGVTGASGKVFVFSGAGAGALVDRTDLGLPSGTVAVFRQSSAPTGWTKDTSNNNNSALRVVTGNVSIGGTVDFTTAFASQTPSGTVGDTTLTVDQIPAHTHDQLVTRVGAGDDNQGTGSTFGNNSEETGSTGGGQSHTHTFTGNAINLAVKYTDVIQATKD